MKIKNLNPCYVYKDGIEIDFLIPDHTLIDVGYNTEMNRKQRLFFESMDYMNKIEIKNINDLDNFLNSLKSK